MRRTTALALATALSLSLAACGGSGSDSAKKDSSGTSASGSTTKLGPSATAKPTPPGPGDYDDTSGTKAHPPSSQVKVLDALPGSKSAACATVGTQSAVRSGSVAMGDFKQAQSVFKKAKGAYDAQPSFFYVIPQTAKLSKATVRFAPLSGKGKTISIATRQHEDAGQWKYYPIHVKLTSGKWRAQVSSGTSKGCFIFDLKA
jgi:hypothetical protein